MRRGTKKIRKISIRGTEYFCYDLDPNEAGIRVRVYGKTEEELQEKIQQATKERDARLQYEKPDPDDKLYEYIIFYMKNLVGKRPTETMHRELMLVDTIVKNSEVNIAVSQLKVKTVMKFINNTIYLYGEQIAQTLFTIIRNSLALDYVKSVLPFDVNELQMAHFNKVSSGYKDFLTEEQLQRLTTFCITNRRSYGNAQDTILFGAITGIRIQDAVELLAEEVSVTEGGIAVKDTIFPVGEMELAWFEDYLVSVSARKPDTDPHLFLTRDGVPMTLRAVRGTLAKMRLRLGLPVGVTPMALYESFLVIQLEKGVSASILAKRYGVSPETLRRYQSAKLLWERLRLR